MKDKRIWRSFDKNTMPTWPEKYDKGPFLMTAASLIAIDGTQLALLNGNNTLLFRHMSVNSAEWTYFLYDSADQNAYTFDETWFEKKYRSKQYGRVIPIPVTPAPDCKEFELLYFRSDGTGCVYPGPYQDDFSWGGLWEWPIDPIIESFELMSYIGRLVFDDWNSKRENPRIDRNALEDEPLEFINGSQEELERVTRWICHSGIGKPESKGSWEITYYAPHTERDRTGGVWEWSFRESPKLRELFNLAYEYNSFTGYHWEYTDESTRFRDGFTPEPLQINFSFPYAVRGVQTEASLELMRWLDGKVTAEEIQKLFGSAYVPKERKQ